MFKKISTGILTVVFLAHLISCQSVIDSMDAAESDDGDEYGGYDGDYNYGTDDCLGDEYTCPSDGFCIQSSKVCDGFKDCADGSDENCTESTTAVSSTATTEDYSYPACGSNEFHCGGGICTALANVCNGIKECPNGLDEEDCDYVDYEDCSPEEFKCQNGVCVHKSALCDGIHDCDDGSDENNCTARSTVPSVVSTTASDYYDYDDCESNEFHCGSGVCIPKTSLCDNVHDCHDGSDETDCPFNKDNTTSSTPKTSSNLVDITTHPAATTATPTHDSATLSATDKQCLYEGARYPAGSTILVTNCTEVSCSPNGRLSHWKSSDPGCSATTATPSVTMPFTTPPSTISNFTEWKQQYFAWKNDLFNKWLPAMRQYVKDIELDACTKCPIIEELNCVSKTCVDDLYCCKYCYCNVDTSDNKAVLQQAWQYDFDFWELRLMPSWNKLFSLYAQSIS